MRTSRLFFILSGAPLLPELIDMPPAFASEPRMSILNAAGSLWAWGTTESCQKYTVRHHITVCSLCPTTRVSCVAVSLLSCPLAVRAQASRLDKPFFFCNGLNKSVDTR